MKIQLLNKIAKIGLDELDSSYTIGEDVANADGIMEILTAASSTIRSYTGLIPVVSMSKTVYGPFAHQITWRNPRDV